MTDTPLSATSTAECMAPRPVSSLALFILLLGGFITIFDLFVVNIAIASIQESLGASFADIAFVIAGYELAFGVLLIAGSRLGDRHGRRRLFILGMLAFTLSSLLCGIASSANMLIAARLSQGAAGALLFPQIYASLRVIYDEKGRSRAFSLLGMTLGLAAIAGQVIGGLLVEMNLFGLGWRVVFLINIPIGMLAVIGARTIPESKAETGSDIDWPGVLLVSSGLLLLLLPLLEGPNIGWPLWTGYSFIAGLALIAIFLIWQHRLTTLGGTPIISLTLFRHPAFSIGSLCVLLIYSTATSLFLCFALLLQSGLGLSPFAAGMLFAPCSIGFIAASLSAPKLVSRFGNKIIVLGATLYAAGIGGLMMMTWNFGSQSNVIQLIWPLIILGFGQGIAMTPMLNLVIGYVEERHAGIAAGFISTMQQVGGAFGVSVAGIFFMTILTHDASLATATRYLDAFSGAMIYNLAAVVIATLLISQLIRHSRG
ncbi:MFS transporter [Klebsiella sp. BIGb0407]|uniref:MFS transporter n=1 Tax=Klebsiella sp. BIGb0407 TaxID=2940603 RepID=UPI00216A57A5|nr:MFS transporter [Klebsiella sp. BIGb0407]MCS3431950.1 EmrB/QacA subfamily drug resistance transporter [Klebsiella sp. BIGb0407]